MTKDDLFIFKGRTFRFTGTENDCVIAVCLTPEPEDRGNVWWCIPPQMADRIEGPFSIH